MSYIYRQDRAQDRDFAANRSPSPILLREDNEFFAIYLSLWVNLMAEYDHLDQRIRLSLDLIREKKLSLLHTPSNIDFLDFIVRKKSTRKFETNRHYSGV